MKPKLQGFEIEAVLSRDDDFAVEYTALRQLRLYGIEKFGEVAVQWFLLPAVNEDVGAIAEYECAKAVPFGFKDPGCAGRQLVDSLGEHRGDRRIYSKLHQIL